jgi:hypothetical protein
MLAQQQGAQQVRTSFYIPSFSHHTSFRWSLAAPCTHPHPMPPSRVVNRVLSHQDFEYLVSSYYIIAHVCSHILSYALFPPINAPMPSVPITLRPKSPDYDYVISQVPCPCRLAIGVSLRHVLYAVHPEVTAQLTMACVPKVDPRPILLWSPVHPSVRPVRPSDGTSDFVMGRKPICRCCTSPYRVHDLMDAET